MVKKKKIYLTSGQSFEWWFTCLVYTLNKAKATWRGKIIKIIEKHTVFHKRTSSETVGKTVKLELASWKMAKGL